MEIFQSIFISTNKWNDRRCSSRQTGRGIPKQQSKGGPWSLAQPQRARSGEGRGRPPGHSEFQDPSVSTPANSGNNPSLSGYSRVPAGGARNRRLIRFVDQIFVHPLNRIVWYKISVISTHTDTKTSVSARKAAYLNVNVTQFTHTGSKLFRDLCKTNVVKQYTHSWYPPILGGPPKIRGGYPHN